MLEAYLSSLNEIYAFRGTIPFSALFGYPLSFSPLRSHRGLDDKYIDFLDSVAK